VSKRVNSSKADADDATLIEAVALRLLERVNKRVSAEMPLNRALAPTSIAFKINRVMHPKLSA
jgi:hypothetical protein